MVFAKILSGMLNVWLFPSRAASPDGESPPLVWFVVVVVLAWVRALELVMFGIQPFAIACDVFMFAILHTRMRAQGKHKHPFERN